MEDAIQKYGFWLLGLLVTAVGWFAGAMKSEVDKKITTLFSLVAKLQEDIASLRERVARLEK